MANPDLGDAVHGRLYRVAKHWYLDTALLKGIARRITVEPMQGGYQILAPAGLLRCTPATGQPLPGQTGDLFRCQGQSAEQDVGEILRKLAGERGADMVGGEWEQWPGGVAASKKTCCTSCAAGAPCPCGDGPHAHDDEEAQSPLERLLVSETLGTVAPRKVSQSAIALYPGQHGAPEWAAGRYHECIASILRFPDLASGDWIVLLDTRSRGLASTWGVTLDRQRTLMLTEIVQLVARLTGRTARDGSVRPAAPSRQTPGAGAWELAATLADEVHRTAPLRSGCELCPYRLGTNLRCPVCRQWLLARKPTAKGSQEAVLIKLLAAQTELRGLPSSTLRTLGEAIAESHAQNMHEPLTDRFFVALERDVLRAANPLQLDVHASEAVLEIAEMSPLDPQVAVGVAARREAT